MIRKEVTKLYKGKIDIRDYERQEAIDRGVGMKITYKNEVMTLSPREVKTKIKIRSKLFKSKIGGLDYCLCSYNWNPDEKKEG